MSETIPASIHCALIGEEREPVITFDRFAPDPEALRACAAAATFDVAGEHYPGIRASLPPSYLGSQLPLIAKAIMPSFGRFRRIRVIDASFSLVTHPPGELHSRQRVPHVDAYGRERVALVHYLSLSDPDGTAFFRHRSTGFETVDADRAPAYFAALGEEMSNGEEPPAGYIAGDTSLFERIRLAPASYNRAVLYRSCLLHSGAISSDASLSPDPLRGRLTVTGFFALE